MTEIEKLNSDIRTLKKEVDAIQISLLKEKAPWYKNVSNIVAIIALLFSFGTTFVSYSKMQQQKLLDSKNELRGLLQRLTTLPKENFELLKKYDDDSNGKAQMSGFVNQENTLLLQQVKSIITELPEESVNSVEYLATANALLAAYDINTALVMYKKALDVTDDFNTEIMTRRSYASTLLNNGNIEEGREQFDIALNIFSKYKEDYNEFTKVNIHFITYIAWAYAEANNKNFKDAHKLIERAGNIIEPLPNSPGKMEMQNRINQILYEIGLHNEKDIDSQKPSLLQSSF